MTTLVFVLAAAHPTSAGENCPCTLDADLQEKLLPLIESNLEIQDQLGRFEGRAFHKTPEEIEAYKLFAKHEDYLRTHCPSLYRKLTRHYQVMVRMVASPRGGAGESIVPKSKVAGADWELGPLKAILDTLATNTSNLAGKDQEQYRREGIAATLRNLSLSDLTKAYGSPTARVELALLKLTSQTRIEDYQKQLDSLRGELTGDEKIALIANLGEVQTYQLYDDDLLANEKYTDFKEIKPQHMLDAFREVIYSDNAAMKAGICRHISTFQVATAKGLGLDGYVYSYRARGGLHTAPLVVDPKNRTKAYLLNYDEELTKVGVDGGQLLYQGKLANGDETTVYNVASVNHDGTREKTVAFVSGESLKLYEEAAGMDIRDIEPLARKSASLVAAEARIGAVPVRLFIGEDGNRDRYVGIASNVNWGTRRFPGAAGVVVAARKLDSVGGPDQASREPPWYADVHLHVEQTMLKLGKEFKIRQHELAIRADALALTIANFSRVIHTSDKEADHTPAFMVADMPIIGPNIGAEAELNHPGSRLHAKLRAETQVRLGAFDITRQVPGAFVNTTTVSASVAGRIGEHRVMAESITLFDAFGPKELVRAGYGYQDFAIQGEVSGRIRDNSVLLREGSLRQAQISAAKQFGIGDVSDLTLYFSTAVPLEGPEMIRAITLTGGAKGQF